MLRTRLETIRKHHSTLRKPEKNKGLGQFSDSFLVRLPPRMGRSRTKKLSENCPNPLFFSGFRRVEWCFRIVSKRVRSISLAPPAPRVLANAATPAVAAFARTRAGPSKRADLLSLPRADRLPERTRHQGASRAAAGVWPVSPPRAVRIPLRLTSRR